MHHRFLLAAEEEHFLPASALDELDGVDGVDGVDGRVDELDELDELAVLGALVDVPVLAAPAPGFSVGFSAGLSGALLLTGLRL